MSKHFCKSIIKYNKHNFIYLEDIQCIDEVKEENNEFSFELFLIDNSCFVFKEKTKKKAETFRNAIISELHAFISENNICINLHSRNPNCFIFKKDIENLIQNGRCLKIFLRNNTNYEFIYDDWDEARDFYNAIIKELEDFYNL